MARKDYLSMLDAELPGWFNNFSINLPSHQATLGLTQEELDAVALDAATVAFVINGVDAVRDYSQSWTDFKDAMLKGDGDANAIPALPTLSVEQLPMTDILGRTRELVKRIKSHANYTDAIGQALGIIGAEATEPEAKPTGKANRLPNYEVEITFVKRSFDGVDIESQRGDETAWAYLAFDGRSPYNDRRPPLTAGQPEVRRYRLRYRKNDEPVGEYSDVLTVTASE